MADLRPAQFLSVLCLLCASSIWAIAEGDEGTCPADGGRCLGEGAQSPPSLAQKRAEMMRTVIRGDTVQAQPENVRGGPSRGARLPVHLLRHLAAVPDTPLNGTSGEEALRAVQPVGTLSLLGEDAEGQDCRGGTHGTACFQGDMLLLEAQHSSLLQAQGGHASEPWSGAEVKYCFAADVSDEIKDLMVLAMSSIKHAVPCLAFTDVGNPNSFASAASRGVKACAEAPALFIQSGPGGCWAHLGMLNQSQLQTNGLKAAHLNMQDPFCRSFGAAVHEMLHALGLTHEVFPVDEAQGRHEASPTSIMHYHAYHALRRDNRNGAKAMEGRHHNIVVNGLGMMEKDAQRLASMYKEASCSANSLAGPIGCADTGTTDCGRLEVCKVGSDAMDDCCACGAGINYPCWNGSECRQVAELEVEAAVDDVAKCVADRSAMYRGAGGCVIQNYCEYGMKITCDEHPGLSLLLPSKSGHYRSPFQQPCSERVRCSFEQLR